MFVESRLSGYDLCPGPFLYHPAQVWTTGWKCFLVFLQSVSLKQRVMDQNRLNPPAEKLAKQMIFPPLALLDDSYINQTRIVVHKAMYSFKIYVGPNYSSYLFRRRIRKICFSPCFTLYTKFVNGKKKQ